MNRTMYQVEMSTDGKHKVTVTIEDPAGTDAALAWAKPTYSKLLRSDTATEGQALAGDVHEEPPTCGIHQVPMVRVQGRRGPFWTCHEKNDDGSWCSYRAPSHRDA